MPEYSRGKIYKIVCNETGLIYVGSTCEPTLARRLAKHVREYKYWKEGKQCFMTSYNILEKQNYDIVLLESCPCESKDELHKRERHYIETLDCVNKIIVGRSQKEYYMANKDKLSKEHKEYREKNKDKIQKVNKQYRNDNKEKINAHKFKVSMCECGREYTNHHKTRHEKTKVHQNYIESLKEI